MTYITVTANPSLNRIWKVLSYDGDRGADTIFLKEVVGGSGIVVSEDFIHIRAKHYNDWYLKRGKWVKKSRKCFITKVCQPIWCGQKGITVQPTCICLKDGDEI